MATGFILYRGPSMIDGSPIVCIATGIEGRIRNEKTGAMVQTWILRDDMSPLEATATGADKAICGDCQHRGEIVDGKNVNRSCYVAVFQAPLSVYKSHKRGIYAELSPTEVRETLAGRRVRMGAYGDPAAVPLFVWENALAHVNHRTGYTHQWRYAPKQFARFLMASCDSVADYELATSMGYRTFRIRKAGEALQAREAVCPASKEAGERTNCAACVACGGHGAKAKVNISIIIHGAANKVNAHARRAA